MSPIYWHDIDNSVGNSTIDAQHKQWVKIFNQLEASLIDPTSPPSQSQKELLTRILDFTREHFRDEEQLMNEYGYPDAARHRRMHKEFEQQLYEKFRMVMAGELVLHSELIAMIRHWFINHTSSEDRKTFAHIDAASDHKKTAAGEN